MTFDEAIKINGLGEIIDAQYGKWGHFTQEVASIISSASKLELSFSYLFPQLNVSLEVLAAAIAVTAMNESVFNPWQQPNTNKNNANWFGFDIGMMQLNLGWTLRMIMQHEVDALGLSFVDSFGAPPYIPKKPFTGDPVTNARLGIRRLLSLSKPPTGNTMVFADKLEMQVTCYTGVDHRVHRQQDWRKYKEPFVEFFKRYYE